MCVVIPQCCHRHALVFATIGTAVRMVIVSAGELIVRTMGFRIPENIREAAVSSLLPGKSRLDKRARLTIRAQVKQNIN